MNSKRVCLLTCEDLDRHPDGQTARDDDFLIRELQSAGFSVDVTPWNQFQTTSDCGIVVVRTTWDYTQRCEEFLAKMRAIQVSGVLLMNPYSILKWNSHKSYLVELGAKGVPVVPTVILKAASDLKELEQVVAQWPTKEWILKPAVSATSAGLMRIKRFELAAALMQSQATGRDFLIQPYYPEILKGEISLHFFGKRYSHAVIKHPASGDFRVQEAFGGRYEKVLPSKEEVEFCGRILRQIPDPLLVARVDFIRTPQGPLLMELELIEPTLFFASDPTHAPKKFVDALVSQCTS